MHKPRVHVEEAVERCVIAKKYKIFRKFNWGFCISRPIEQFYADGSPSPAPCSTILRHSRRTQIGEPSRLSPTRVERAEQQIAQIVSSQSARQEFSSGAAQPIFSVALVEAFFQQ